MVVRPVRDSDAAPLSELNSSSSILLSWSFTLPNTLKCGSLLATLATMWIFTAAFLGRCFAQSMHQYVSCIVDESIA